MNKDVTFNITQTMSSSSNVEVLYGDKKVFTCRIFDADITEFKAGIMAVQIEMLKDQIILQKSLTS